jgi:Ca2+-binding RTX toxin-like protein
MWLDCGINYTFHVIGYVTEFDGITSEPSATSLPHNSLTIASNGDRIVVGDGNANRLTGGTNDDVLAGLTGDDDLTGGSGSDTFIFAPSSGDDTIVDFKSEDVIDFNAFDFADDAVALALASQTGADVVFDFGGGNTLTVQNFQKTDFADDNILV